MERVSFDTFCSDPQLINEPVSKAWSTFYAIVEGLPLDEEGEALYRAATGRDRYEPRVYTEATALCGRRSEKTTSGLKYLLWQILFAGWEKQLRGSWFSRVARHTRLLRVFIIAQDMRVCRDIQRVAESLVLGSRVLANEVAEVLARELVFKNGIALTCFPASKASVRGLCCPAGLIDELSWVSIEGASDVELCRQVRPAMIQFGDARRLVKLSTPWQACGILFDEFSRRHERADLLVWQASTSTMTPRISAKELAREQATDPQYFRREYLAEFTDDLAAFVPDADASAAVASWTELPPDATQHYTAALDASGLTGGDRFTFGIAHRDGEVAAVDVLRGWRRAPVPEVVNEVCVLAHAYGVRRIVCDQYGFAFVSELFRERGVALDQLAFTSRSKPEVFFALKAALAQGNLLLPDHAEALRELRSLESQRTSGGSYKIGAPRGLHDDFATVLALLAHELQRRRREPLVTFISDDPAEDAMREEERRARWQRIG